MLRASSRSPGAGEDCGPHRSGDDARFCLDSDHGSSPAWPEQRPGDAARRAGLIRGFGTQFRTTGGALARLSTHPSQLFRGVMLALAALLHGAGAEAGGACRPIEFEGLRYTVCEVAAADLRLFQADGTGAPWGHFARLDAALRESGERLAVAMNGGMYHDDRRPVGYTVIEGREVAPLVTREGPGNFGMLPNGVFCLAGGEARIMETLAFADVRPACRDATQSGPMLVIGGELHPRFLPGSDSRHIRNGVGVRGDGGVVLAISDELVTFHEFARLFRDGLETPDALYLDGSVSRLWAPEIGREDFGRAMGPILGTVGPAG